MRRVILLNRFFSPDQSATSQFASDLATDLASRGHDVHVITSRQLYEDSQAGLPSQETLRGVRVHRVTTTHFGRSKLIGRAVDYLSFYATAWRTLLEVTRPGDVLVAMTDPPLISLIALQVANRQRAYLVNWLQDIYPEVAVALNVPLLKGPIVNIIAHQRDRSLEKAEANVVIGGYMADKVASRGISRDRIHVISNWCENEIIPVAPSENPLRREWGLENKFVVGYCGNLGRAHEFDTILVAAERLRGNSDIVFMCYGGGYLMDRLAQCVQERGLANFKFMGYRDRAVLKFALGVPDVHWISLRPEVEGLIVPSKFYGIAAAGRPVIAICTNDGEIARIVKQYQCGCVVEPGNVGALVDLILQLLADAALRAEMGQRARAVLEAHFSSREALARWRQLLEHVGKAQ